MRNYLRNYLGIEEHEDRISELEKKVEDLKDLRNELMNNVLQDRQQLQFILENLEDGAETKTSLVSELTDKFDISRATAYRRIKELEEKAYITEKDDSKVHIVVSNK